MIRFGRRDRRGAGIAVAAALAGAIEVAGAVSLADEMATAPLPPTVERLDAERGQIRRDTVAAEARAADVRREVSGYERRRQEALRALEAEGAALAAREREAELAVRALGTGLAERDAEIEHVLRAGGQWVSFTHDIAPILRARCVACHTAREPGGGHVMTHHAALLADSGAGAAVVPGDPDSALVRVVADGSMPKDGTPLAAAEVDLIRRWVARGARLDAGADPEAALVRIMPRQRQPDPPAVYPAAVPASALAFHPDGTRLASAGYHEVLVWSVPEGRLLGRVTNVAERVLSLAFHPDGRRLAVAAGTPGTLGEVKVFDADTGALLADLGAADDAMLAVAFTPDGGRIAAAGADPALRLFNSGPFSPVGEHADHADWVQGIAFSADGRRIVTASRDKTAKVVDTADGRLVTTFPAHQAPVQAAAWLPGGTLVATGGADGAVRIWEAEGGKETRRIGGFAGSVDVLAVVGDERIAAGDRTGTVRLHSLADGKKLGSFAIAQSPLTALAVSRDGRHLAAGTLDGTIGLITLSGDPGPVRWQALPAIATPGATPSAAAAAP